MKLKKLLLLLLAFILPLTLVGCGRKTYDASKNIKTDGVFNYIIVENEVKVTYENEDGEEIEEIVPDNYIQIVSLVKNAKNVTIPEKIEDLPVRVISDMAFFEFFKLLGLITIPTSNLKQITLPNTVERIGKYAFYQAKNLEAITIPSSVKVIGEYAFASAKGLKEIVINRNEPDYINYVSSSNNNEIIITGGRSSYAGDVFRVTSNVGVTWESSNPSVASIDPDTGRISALKVGTYTITATATTSSGSIKPIATINMEVFPDNKTLKFSDRAFDRLFGLEKLVLNVKNPNSFDVNVDELKFTKDVKIYVPKEAVEFYKTHGSWKRYESQIFPIA